ncbi:MAG: nucleotide pyrophosphohydrolase [Candidatus Amulumruptor caecigallinarius]|nr:nucleotide pyrophosphohydrolase [Candidatus Amulumruptor caecigallinarius]
MTINEMQRTVDTWIREVGGGYFSELTNMVLLTEETGELARVVARVYGDQVAKESDGLNGDAKEKLGEEIADVLWVLTCIANQTGINLEDAFAATLRKKSERDRNRFLKRN